MKNKQKEWHPATKPLKLYADFESVEKSVTKLPQKSHRAKTFTHSNKAQNSIFL